jgi:hypothetical protein
MICKYCHENTHLIDVCPIIICKICKDIGHPQWLCIKKKNNNKFPNKNLNDNKKELNVKIEISSNNVSDKNLNYYIKNIDESWDNFFI